MSEIPTREQAAQALREVEQTRGRTGRSMTYGAASLHVFIWAGVWILANLLCGIAPRVAGSIWLACAAVGVGASIIANRVLGRWPDARPLLCMAGAALFIVALGVVLGLRTGEQIDAAVSLLIGLAYFTVGVWKGARFSWAGGALSVLTLVGWLLLPGYFYFWMAAAGGAVLALTGAWLTRA